MSIEEQIRDFCVRTDSRIEFDRLANGDSTPVTVTHANGRSCVVNVGESVWVRTEAWEMLFLHAIHELEQV